MANPAIRARCLGALLLVFLVAACKTTPSPDPGALAPDEQEWIAIACGDRVGPEWERRRADSQENFGHVTGPQVAGNADLEALYALSLLCGLGHPQDTAEAIYWFREAAARGHQLATENLVVLFSRENPVYGSNVELLFWLAQMIAREQAPGLTSVADDVALTFGGGDQMKEAFAYMEDALAREAMPRRLILPWMRERAEAGDRQAQFLLGLILASQDPDEVPPDSVYWWEQAAAQDYSPAQVRLGRYFASRSNQPEAARRSVEYFRAAADKGDGEALAMVGRSYEDGLGQQQDYQQALHWYRLSAAQGHPFGQAFLADLYANGSGVPQDYSQALRLHRLAALQGFDLSQFWLGISYYHGVGAQEDREKALLWLSLARHNGFRSELLDDMIESLTAKLTAAERAAVARAVETCLDTDYEVCD